MTDLRRTALEMGRDNRYFLNRIGWVRIATETGVGTAGEYMMETIRNVIVWIIGLFIAGFMLVIMAFVGLAAVGFFVVAITVGILVAAFSRQDQVSKRPRSRVWKDKDGTVIDM